MVIAKGLPVPMGVRRVPVASGMGLSHHAGGNQDDAVGPGDLVAPQGIPADQSITTHQHLHGSAMW